MGHHSRMLTALLLAALGGACSRPGASPAPAPPPAAETAVRVTDVDLGRSLGADKRVTEKTDSFKPNETVYVSVTTEGSAPTATLKARWTYEGGQLVQESSQTIAPTGAAVTEFHVAKPDGWPKGSYKVEVFLNGNSVETESFKVG
jgi:cellulase/cellobiase CelA1